MKAPWGCAGSMALTMDAREAARTLRQGKPAGWRWWDPLDWWWLAVTRMEARAAIMVEWRRRALGRPRAGAGGRTETTRAKDGRMPDARREDSPMPKTPAMPPDDDASFRAAPPRLDGLGDLLRQVRERGPELAHFLRAMEAAGHQLVTDADRQTLMRLGDVFGGRGFTPREANERVAADPLGLLRLARYGLLEVGRYRVPARPRGPRRLQALARAAWGNIRARAKRASMPDARG